jgi:hypothetical protein
VAFSDDDLAPVRKLDKELPKYERGEARDFVQRVHQPKYLHPNQPVSFETIQQSGTIRAVVNPGATFVRVSDNRALKSTEVLEGKFYRLPDELGFKYLIGKNEKVEYKIRESEIVEVEPDYVLYEPPNRYTPAEVIIQKVPYDRGLALVPELSVYTGYSQGNYMRDLFNDKAARYGTTAQVALHAFGNWNYLLRPGAVLNYERTLYGLSGGGQVTYSSLSFGPQFRSKDLHLNEFSFRIQGQFRFSPFARLQGETTGGAASFKFYSSDVLFSVEHPIKNPWGEFAIGLFYQRQWLSIRSQQEIVSVRPSNRTNDSLGLALTQVFQ